MSFDSISALYINLDRRPDRREHIERELYNNGWSTAERLSAVDGKNIDISSLEPSLISSDGLKKMNDVKNTSLTMGGIGCALSHKLAWERAMENNGLTVIFEDDVQINCSPEQVRDLINRVPSDWDILYLGSGQYEKMKEHNTGHPDIVKVEYAFCTYGYVIRPKSLNKLMKIFPLTNQIDTDMYSKGLGLNSYVVEPNLVLRKDFGTDIQLD